MIRVGDPQSTVPLAPSQSLQTGAVGSNRFQFLQNKDVFFSRQSQRAQIEHFLKRHSGKPMVISYVPPDDNSGVSKYMPKPAMDVVLLTPYYQPDETETDRIGVLLDDAELEAPSEGDGQNREYVIFNEVASPPPEPNTLRLEQFKAAALDSVESLQLDGLFQTFQLPEGQTPWVTRSREGTITLLPTFRPEQAGLVQRPHPIWSRVLGVIAPVISWLLGLPIEQNRLVLPNRATVDLSAKRWVNAEGKPVDVFQVRRLPHNRWVRLIEEPDKVDNMPLGEGKTIREGLQQWLEPLESLGKIRLAYHDGQDAPAITPVPKANPFATHPLTAREPEATFLY